jgi:exopolysaccharide production protein ExoQ
VKEFAILWATVAFALWAIQRDNARRDGASAALWIPTLWLGILASRPLSCWLGHGVPDGPQYSMEGSPIDGTFFLVLIVAASVVVVNRQPNWSSFVSRNWPILLFYLYLLVTVLWAESSLVSFKRWFKEVGNIMVAMVILTEQNPRQALRAVFVRCGYLLIPLSVVFARYFPELGRSYTIGGDLEVTGVTFQKNSLGAMILVCCLAIVWDLLENKLPGRKARDRVGLLLQVGILILGGYLLHLCDSKTSTVCLALGGGILATTRMPVLRNKVGSLGLWTLSLVVFFVMIDSVFGIKEAVIQSLGRDMTFTGRTNIWHEIAQQNIDPLIGTGFCSFWTDQHYLSKMFEGIPRSAHNGYLEVYIEGGYIAVALLAILLGVTALRINTEMRSGGTYALFRYAVLVVVIVHNFSESEFAMMAPIGFLFIVAAIDGPWRQGFRLRERNYSWGSVPQQMRQMESRQRPC